MLESKGLFNRHLGEISNVFFFFLCMLFGLVSIDVKEFISVIGM